jgi:serine/threonine-protein kinase
MAIQIGQALGNYRVVKKLGAGGIGTVYLAEHPLIGKKVALKVIHRELARDAEVVQRFVNEARAVNRIGNEHILDITDIGKTDAGEHFLVMEHLKGQSLADLLRAEGRLAVPRALRIGAQIAQGLAAAHAAGIVHRDLKPDNVFLVSRRGEPDFVKLLDFGLAKLIDPGSPALTRAGVVLGTPQYMSPEQCESRGNIDHRSDIYAVGVLLYQMVTGVLPFDGQSMGEILIKHVSDPPLPPRAVNAAVPEAVEQIILRCLAKAPEERFASMPLLAAALTEPDAWLAGRNRPTEGPPSERRRQLGQGSESTRRPRIVQRPERRPSRALPALVFALLAIALSMAGVLLVRELGRPAAGVPDAPPPLVTPLVAPAPPDAPPRAPDAPPADARPAVAPPAAPAAPPHKPRSAHRPSGHTADGILEPSLP